MEKFLITEGNPNAVDQLLNHERTKILTKDGNAFVFKGRKYRGFTSKMKKRFFPHYSGAKRRRTSRSGRQVGTRVHRQLYHMIECVRRKKGVCDCKTKTNPRRLHAYTLQALAKMKELGITPQSSEDHIFSTNAARGTSLDIIGTRWDKRSVVISIKTGYSCGYDTNLTEQFMLSPLDKIPCTEKNQNMLQGMLESITLEKEYKLKFDDYIIIYLGHGEKKEAKEEYLDSWCLQPSLRQEVYKAFGENP